MWNFEGFFWGILGNFGEFWGILGNFFLGNFRKPGGLFQSSPKFPLDPPLYRARFTEQGLQSKVYRARFTEQGLQSKVYRARFTEQGLQSKVYRARFTEQGLQSKVYRARFTEQSLQSKISAILLAEFFDIRPGLLCSAARRSGSGIGGTVAIIKVQRY